jgi:hypothetical protein
MIGFVETYSDRLVLLVLRCDMCVEERRKAVPSGSRGRGLAPSCVLIGWRARRGPERARDQGDWRPGRVLAGEPKLSVF